MKDKENKAEKTLETSSSVDIIIRKRGGCMGVTRKSDNDEDKKKRMELAAFEDYIKKEVSAFIAKRGRGRNGIT